MLALEARTRGSLTIITERCGVRRLLCLWILPAQVQSSESFVAFVELVEEHDWLSVRGLFTSSLYPSMWMLWTGQQPRTLVLLGRVQLLYAYA